MKVLVIPADDAGCGNYRVIEPYSNIQSEIQFVVHSERNLFSDYVFSFDGVLFQRPMTKYVDELIKDLKNEGKTVVVETDDDLNNLEANNPAKYVYDKEKLDTYNNAIRNASAVHVSTPQLKEIIKNPNVEVFLNAINFKKYSKNNGNKTEIMWYGSTSHAESLALIKPVLDDLSKDHKVVVCSNKMWLESMKFNENVEIRDFVPFKDHHTIMRNAKVVLAPAVDNTMNRSRSELKCLEAAMFNIPVICSNIAPYKRFNDLCKGNILVKNKYIEWIKAVEVAAKTPDYGFKSKICVRDFYNLENINKKRESWWLKALNNS